MERNIGDSDGRFERSGSTYTRGGLRGHNHRGSLDICTCLVPMEVNLMLRVAWIVSRTIDCSGNETQIV